MLGVVGEVRRSPSPLLFADSSSLLALWRFAYFGWFPLAGWPWIPPYYAWGAPVQPLRHHFLSSSIGDEFNECWVRTMFFRVFSSVNGNSKRCSWEESKKWSESLNKCQKCGKKAKYAVFYGVTRQPGNAFKEVDVQGSLKFNPFSPMRFNSSKNIRCFSRKLKWFQTLPWVSSKLNRRPWAYSEISMFSTLHRRDEMNKGNESVIKGYPEKLSLKPPRSIWCLFAVAKHL